MREYYPLEHRERLDDAARHLGLAEQEIEVIRRTRHLEASGQVMDWQTRIAALQAEMLAVLTEKVDEAQHAGGKPS